jgi:lysozyme family protein
MSDKAVAFNATSTSDNPPIIGPTGSILLGLYGTAGMMVFPKGSTPYTASMAAVGTGALAYYYNYFG